MLGGLNTHHSGEYYSCTNPLIDLVKRANAWNILTYVSADGWIRGMPSGAAQNYVWLHIMQTRDNALYRNRLQLGDYYLTWNGASTLSIASRPGLTVSGGGYGVVSPSGYPTSSAHRFKFAVTDRDACSLLQLLADNSSGSNVDITDAKVFRADHETLLAAGELFDPDYLESLGGASIIRLNANWAIASAASGGGGYPVVNFTDLPAESWMTYNDFFPMSLIGKLCTKLSVTPHICCDWRATDACLASMAAELAANWTGNVLAEGGCEGWNTAFSGYTTFLGTNYPTGVAPWTGISVVDASGIASSNLTDKMACSTADVSARWWKALENVIGTSRVYRVIDTQEASTAHGAFYKFKPACYGGLTMVQDLLNSAQGRVMVAPYWSLDASGAFVAGVGRKSLVEQHAENYTDAQWDASFRANIDTQVAWINAHIAYMGARAPNCILGTYEGGPDTAVSAALEPVNAGWSCTVDATGDELIFDGDYSGIFTSGDYVHLVSTLVSGLGISQQVQCTVRLNAGVTKMKLYESGNYPTTPFNMPVLGGTHMVENKTRSNAVLAKARSVTNGSRGYDLCQYVYDQLYVGKLWNITLYMDSDTWDDNFAGSWGMKPGMVAADYADADYQRALWFRNTFNTVAATDATDTHDGVGGKKKRKQLYEIDVEPFGDPSAASKLSAKHRLRDQLEGKFSKASPAVVDEFDDAILVML